MCNPILKEGQNADDELVKKHVEELRKHFDSVQIFCTRHDADEIGTAQVSIGSGNWFSRYGQILVWLNNKET